MEGNFENKKKEIPWVHPDLEKEKPEIERALGEFLGIVPDEEIVNIIMEIFKSSPVVDLSDKEWESLENTDSYFDIRPGHIEDVRKIASKYNDELPEENKRDFAKLLSSFLEGNKIDSPLILKNKEGRLHLVSGNNRLMICRALEIKPKVIIGKI